MRKLLFLFLLVSACPFAAQAQDDVSELGFFAGYSYLRTGSGYDQDSHGWNAAISVNLTKHIAAKADFAGHYDRYTIRNPNGNINVNTSLHTFLFGPQFNFRASERFNPFVHALFGAAHDDAKARQGNASAKVEDTGFAVAVGGGLDAKLGERVSWRVFQTDYLLTRYRNPFRVPVEKRNVNHFRFSSGLVFH